MDKYIIKNLSPNKYSEILTDMLYSNSDFIVNISEGHGKTIHVGNSDIDLIKRSSFENNISWASSFYDEQTFNDFVINALAYKANEIANWFLADRLDFKDTNDYFAKSIVVNFEDEEVGYGFKKGNLSRYTTSSVTVVLQRDMTGASPLGFYLKTAYPTMDKAVKSDISYTEEYFERINDKEMSVPMKLYFYAQTVGISGHINNIDGQDTFKVKLPADNNGTLYAFFTENKTDYKLVNNDGKRRINLGDLYFLSDKAKSLLKIDNKRKELVNSKSETICTKNVSKNISFIL